MSDEAHAAATRIQRVFRGKKGKSEFQEIMRQKMIKAATRIQRGWRSKMAAAEEEQVQMDRAARVIQNHFKIRLARKRNALQEKFGPRALPPYVDMVIPPLRHLKEKVTELLASPTPFAAALGALDAFTARFLHFRRMLVLLGGWFSFACSTRPGSPFFRGDGICFVRVEWNAPRRAHSLHSG